jgi:hypothetical protein
VRECLWLIKNGIPFDVAFALDSTKRTAWAITFSELESGRAFNWSKMEFEDPK